MTSQPFIEEHNRNRAIEEELRQKLKQSGEELRTMPQITSLFHSTQGTIYTQIGKFRTLQLGITAVSFIRFTQIVPRFKTEIA